MICAFNSPHLSDGPFTSSGQSPQNGINSNQRFLGERVFVERHPGEHILPGVVLDVVPHAHTPKHQGERHHNHIVRIAIGAPRRHTPAVPDGFPAGVSSGDFSEAKRFSGTALLQSYAKGTDEVSNVHHDFEWPTTHRR